MRNADVKEEVFHKVSNFSNLDGYSEGMTDPEQRALAVILAHEAHRDGVDNGALTQDLETLLSVKEHTEFLIRMLQEGKNIAGNANLLADLVHYAQGGDAFARYVFDTYDSSADNWKLMKGKDNHWGWAEDGSLDYNFDLNNPEIRLALMSDPLLINRLLAERKTTGNVASLSYSNMDAEIARRLGNALGIRDPEGTVYIGVPGSGPGNIALDKFVSGTMTFAEASDAIGKAIMYIDGSNYKTKPINEGVASGLIAGMMSSLYAVQNTGLFIQNPIGAAELSRLVNLGTEANPLYIPVELGSGQKVHETSSYPGYRMLDVEGEFSPHSGIDLRGIWDSNVVASANGSSAVLGYSNRFGLVVDNMFSYGDGEYKNQLGHLDGMSTIMSFLKNFGTEGVGFDGKQLTGLVAGTVFGKVGNTGYSMGAHLDLNTYEYNARPDKYIGRSPLVSTLYGTYLSNNITATLRAQYLSGFETDDPTKNWQRIKDYYYLNRKDHINFYWDYVLKYGLGN